MMTASSPCLAALNAFAQKEFAEWRGLPFSCTMSDALQAFAPQDEWIGAGKLGSAAVAANYRFFVVPSYPAPVRVWFDDSVIHLVDVEGPIEDLTFQALSERLGGQAVKLDSYFGVVKVDEGEWVYADRGIAFSGDTGRREIYHLWVFAPTTAESYRQHLRMDLRERPMPRPEWM